LYMFTEEMGMESVGFIGKAAEFTVAAAINKLPTDNRFLVEYVIFNFDFFK